MLFVLWFDMNYFWQKGNYIFMNILIKNIKPKLIVNGKFIFRRQNFLYSNFINNEKLVFTLSSILYIPFRLKRIWYGGSDWFTSLCYVRKSARVIMKSCIIVWIVTTIVCWWWWTRFQWLWHCSVRKAIIYHFYTRSV